MKAQILTTGNEVLLGDITDTNCAFLCAKLRELGIEVEKTLTVGDDIDAIAAAIKQISVQADICFVTGGLGPTMDDLTASACAKAAGCALELNHQALESMRSYFEGRGFELNRENEKQAVLPSASHVMVNHNGTAPGFYIVIDRCMFFFMPGVPREMKSMYESSVENILAENFSLKNNIRIKRLSIFGLTESKAGWKLKDFEKKFPGITLGFRADFPMIEVKLMDFNTSEQELTGRADLDEALNWVIDRIGRWVISDRGLTMAQEVGRLLSECRKTLAVAESCTGGLISSMITDVAGSSDYFLFSGITYSNEAKINVLNVKRQTIIEFGAVHEQTAREMAEGAKSVAGADFAVSTTGIAGPGGGTAEKPVGMVCVAVAGPGATISRTYKFLFDERLKNKKIFAIAALGLLRRQIISTIKAF